MGIPLIRPNQTVRVGRVSGIDCNVMSAVETVNKRPALALGDGIMGRHRQKAGVPMVQTSVARQALGDARDLIVSAIRHENEAVIKSASHLRTFAVVDPTDRAIRKVTDLSLTMAHITVLIDALMGNE